MTIPPKKENICAIFVTYHPDKEILTRVLKLSKQVGYVVVVDNNSSQNSLRPLIDAKLHNFTIIANDKNYGIAKALNTGVNFAMKRGFEWALLMDQDSLVNDNMLDVLISAYNAYEYKDRLAVIGSGFIHQNKLNKINYDVPKDVGLFTESRMVITSGSLISINVYTEIGSFRDEFFIDHVDDEYCFKAWDKGFKVILTNEPIMVHNLGTPTVHKLLWRPVTTFNHSAFRKYYMIRNFIKLAKEFCLKEPKWTITTARYHLISVMLICLFEKEKLLKLKAFLKGFVHGLFNINLKKAS